jgi:predicted DNA-binding transcriptional regulator AlpA
MRHNNTLSPNLSALSDRVEQTRSAVRQSCAADPDCQERQLYPAAYTIAQFVRAFGISRAHLYALIRKGQGPQTFTLGTRRLISGSATAAWIRHNEALAAAQLSRGAKP